MSHNRRTAILQLLSSRQQPTTGTELAQHFGVSRQVIVQDIALLRAQGAAIIATPRGYLYEIPSTEDKFVQRLACQHTAQQTRLELTTMIEAGCRVKDVIVEHPLYGEIRGLLLLNNIADVDDFIARYENQPAQLLSSLTEGIHLHTLEADYPGAIKEAKRRLDQLGLLLPSHRGNK